MDKEQKLKVYMEEILFYNESINLTAIKDPKEFHVKHILDSLSITYLDEYKAAKSVIDIGTGAGFPGAILAINNPEKEFTLLDSLNKRLNVINNIFSKIDVKNAKTIHGRAEDFGSKKENRNKFDLAVVRAVSSMPVLLEYALPLVKLNGYFIAYKGTEEEDYSKALEVLGGKLIRIVDSGLSDYGLSHRLIVIKKVKDTPKIYPRKAGTPSKNPII